MTIYKTAVWMTVAIIISKVFGLVREIVFASYFGATIVSDAYFMAISIVTIVGGGIFETVTTSYMPVYSSLVEKEGKKAAFSFTNNLINLLVLLSGIVCIIGIVFSNEIVGLFASGFKGERYQLTVYFVRIIFFSIILISSMNIFNAYLQYCGKFVSVTLAGFAFNFSLFAAILVSAWYTKYFLAWGLLAATMIQLAATYIIARKNGYHHSFIFDFKDKNIRKLSLIAMPIFVATFAGQINALVDKMLASGLPEGSVAALNYGIQISMVIYGLMTMAITTIIYPLFSKKVAADDTSGLEKSVFRALNLVIIILVPVSIGLMVLRVPIIEIIYERGVFDQTATLMTASVLLFFNIGMVGMGIRDVLVKAMFSTSDTNTPMINGIICMVINVILNILLIRTMGIKGLALSTAIAFTVSAIFLLYSFSKRCKEYELNKTRNVLIKSLVSGSIMAVYTSLLCGALLANPDNLLFKAVALALIIGTGAGVYFLIMMALRVEEVYMVKNGLLNRVSR